MITIRSIICKNENGEEIEISYHSDYFLSAVEGISGINTSLNLMQTAQIDGSVYIGERVEPRNIVLTVMIYQDLERKRHHLQRVFSPHKTGTLTYTGDNISRFISYRVESLDIPDSNQPNKFATISLLCPDPFFRDVQEFTKNMADTIPLFTAPFALPPHGRALSVRVFQQEATIVNPGDKDTGLTIVFHAARGTVTNPRLDNLTTGEYVQVNITLSQGQKLVVNTNRGSKGVLLNGVNKSHLKDRESTFFQMRTGENVLKYSAESGQSNLDVYPKWTAEYWGV